MTRLNRAWLKTFSFLMALTGLGVGFVAGGIVGAFLGRPLQDPSGLSFISTAMIGGLAGTIPGAILGSWIASLMSEYPAGRRPWPGAGAVAGGGAFLFVGFMSGWLNPHYIWSWPRTGIATAVGGVVGWTIVRFGMRGPAQPRGAPLGLRAIVEGLGLALGFMALPVLSFVGVVPYRSPDPYSSLGALIEVSAGAVGFLLGSLMADHVRVRTKLAQESDSP